MPSANVIEVGDVTAGIVVFERGGFRFFAAEHAFHALEGAFFRTIDEATRAAGIVSGRARTPRCRNPCRPASDDESVGALDRLDHAGGLRRELAALKRPRARSGPSPSDMQVKQPDWTNLGTGPRPGR